MIRAVLIDDEISNLENLESLLAKHCKQVQVVGVSRSIGQAEQLIKSVKPDLIFLDIQMGVHTGFDLLNLLTDKSFEVIFVTAYDQYGIQAVKFAALDYLLKPVDIDELIVAVTKAEQKSNKKSAAQQLEFLCEQLNRPERAPSKIALPQQQEIRFVMIDEIVRCEADSSYSNFFLSSGEKILVSKPLKEFVDVLTPHHFIRTHQSHFVNSIYVKSWLKEDGGVLLLQNGDKIPISRPHRDSVRAALGR